MYKLLAESKIIDILEDIDSLKKKKEIYLDSLDLFIDNNGFCDNVECMNCPMICCYALANATELKSNNVEIIIENLKMIKNYIENI